MTTLYLVRHGITTANMENRFAGRTGEELHAEGIAQMRQIGDRLQYENIAAVYCGPSRRTVQSAEILGELLSVPFAPIAGLDEIHIPHWDGLTKDEIRSRFGEQYPTWLSAPQAFCLPGCETLERVQDRALKAVSQIVKQGQDQKLLLVSHLIVLRCLCLHFQGLALSDFRSIKIDNGSVLQVSQDGTGRFAVHSL